MHVQLLLVLISALKNGRGKDTNSIYVHDRNMIYKIYNGNQMYMLYNLCVLTKKSFQN